MGGQQRREIVLGGHRGQTREHVLEVGVGIEPAALGGDDQRVDDRGAVAGVGVADEEPVLRPEAKPKTSGQELRMVAATGAVGYGKLTKSK